MLDSRAVRTLSRYFVTRYLGLFTLIFIGATLSIAIVELLLDSDDVLGTRSGVLPLLEFALVRVPSYYLRDLVPISAFFAAFFSIGLSVRWLEWTALEAAGISPRRVVLPILATAVVLAFAMGIARETVVARVIDRIESARRESDEDLLFRDGAFWYQKGRSIFSIHGSDATSGTLRGVEVFERAEHGRLLAHLTSDRVSVGSDGSWQMHDVLVRRFDPAHPERPGEIRTEPLLVLEVGESSALLMEQTDAAALPLTQLIEYLDAHRGDDHPGSRSALLRLHRMVHQRASEPFAVVVFTLLALPLALIVRPSGNLAPAAIVAVAAMASFFLMRSVALGLADREILPNLATVWVVPAFFSTVAVISLWYRTGSGRA